MKQHFGYCLDAMATALPSDRGARSMPIKTGYRPICAVTAPDGSVQLIGLCQLETDADLHPGTTQQVRLKFDIAVATLARGLLPVGARFSLSEGKHSIASAVVLAVCSAQ